MRTSLGAVVVSGAMSATMSCHGPVPGSGAARPVADPPAVGPSEPAPEGRLPGDVRPTHEALALEIDPTRERFGGTADIALRFAHPRDMFWLHGRGLAVSSATVVLASGATLTARWEEVDPDGVVRVTLPRAVSGDATLHVVFGAAYDAQLVGVYRVKTGSGPAVFSKFEAIYARRAFPCFDEPAFKVPFDITLTIPSADAAVANMPVVEDSAVGAATRRVRFATTPPLPSYLVAFAVGPFDTRGTVLAPGAVRAAPLPLGTVALRGRGKDTTYALAEEGRLLAAQERYFGVAFPYPKLDLVAVPDFQSGAMENAGAIAFRDSELLVDDQVTSFAQRIGVTSILAHETAHQWFGDLVTMPWWNDVWLNEGFATFLATRTVQAVRPELEAELSAAASANAAMGLDSLASARRIRQPIETTHDITNAFDGITYAKGAAVLAMLEHFLGDEPFRRGLHDFLVAHATGNATTGELVQALEAAGRKELGPLVSSFLDQPGVPVVAAHLGCEAGHGRVELTQARWRPVGSTISDDAIWTIPVCVRVGIGGRTEEACTVLGARTGTLELPACADWVMPNAQAAGYYRSTLSAEDLARLRDRGTRQLSVVERVMLAHDLEAAFRSAALPGDEVLRGLEPLARDPHGAVASIPLDLLWFVDASIAGGKQRAALRAHVAKLYAPALAALGWRSSPAEAPWRRLFRTRLLGFLALQIEDPGVLEEAARLGRQLLGLDADPGHDPDHDPGHGHAEDVVAPDLADIALSAAARKGGAEVFDALLAKLSGSEDAQRRQRTLAALGNTRDPALVDRALDLALDPRLRQNERLVVLRPLLGSLETREVAWAWLQAHFDALVALLPDRFGGRLPAMVNACDKQHVDEVRAFFTPRIDALSGGPRNLAQALETGEQCAARAQAQRGSVQAYLEALH